MKTYLVRYTQQSSIEVRVKAKDPGDAEAKADKILDSGETDQLTFAETTDPELHSITEERT